MILIDTHTLLWFLRDDPRLSSKAKALIEDANQHKFVSIASCWEIAIKAGLGKLHLTEPSRSLLERELPANHLDLLPISLEHATTVEGLAHHHNDPFDRLLIAQAIVEGIPIIGADVAFDSYPVRRIW
ncbi:type II toxin-antitoxin system VapC family toxin [Tundrisphaera lichenicola]|uniref:type II toxin-antitoxin system VapC family toxin n=1 Tax=Tundrisphaera lichenicola TaxID=2029860 RepID=UPI003EBC63BD